MNRKITPPTSVNELIEDIRQLPGVGRKTATRYAYWLINQDQTYLTKLAKEIHKIKTLVRQCKICYNTAEGEICSGGCLPWGDLFGICGVNGTKLSPPPALRATSSKGGQKIYSTPPSKDGTQSQTMYGWT